MKPIVPSSLVSLSSLYQQIRDQAIQTPHWPAAQTIRDAFEFKDHAYHAPSFDDGNGPIALVALFSESDNPSALPLIQDCVSQFNQFTQDLCDLFTQKEDRSGSPPFVVQPESKLHVIAATVPHICIIVFQEHPSLLSPEQHIHWRPVDEATVHELSNDLSANVFCNVTSSMELQLDSILLTPDGAMIAGFIPIDEISLSSYQFLQTKSAAVVRSRLQTELTSRPKQLIHVTLGRILGYKEHARMDAQNSGRLLQDLIRRYNVELLPSFVAKCKENNQHIWSLQHVTFLRNTVWLCEENTIYHVWDLTCPLASTE